MDKFICYNKYYGRKLTPESFRSTLKMFVTNENFKKRNLLGKMIERLKQLRKIIVNLDGFRFYTSSLLLIYEGNTCDCDLINAVINNDSNNNKDNVNDDCEFCSQDPEKLFDVRVIDFAHSTHSNIYCNNNNNGVNCSSSSCSNSTVTNNHQNTIILHQGYDEGFVFGLDNLIKILALFQND